MKHVTIFKDGENGFKELVVNFRGDLINSILQSRQEKLREMLTKVTQIYLSPKATRFFHVAS